MNQFTRIDPLTDEESRYAAEHYALIHRFLNKKRLPEEDFFDVVVFGYLRAVKRYLEEEKLRKWDFSTIAWRAMRSSVSEYLTAQKRPCRNAVICSLDRSSPEEPTFSLYEVIPNDDKPFSEELEEKLWETEMLSRLTREQRKLFFLWDSGFNDLQIARKLNWTLGRVKGETARMRTLFGDELELA